MSAWQYIVKDSFLREEHFKYFCSIPHEVASDQIKMISKNRVTDSGVKCVVGVPLDVDIAQDIYNTNKEFMWNALSMLAPEKKELYGYTEFNI